MSHTDQYAKIHSEISEIADEAAARATEIDEARSFPRDLFRRMEATGVFHAFAPEEYGGLAMPLEVMNGIIAAAARRNGSMGWLMMVGCAQGPGFGLLPRETAMELMKKQPVPGIRGAIAPKGTAVPVDGGYRVNGRWPFASGGPDPDYVAGNCIVMDGDKPRIGASGMPDTLICLLPTGNAEFLDTWHTLGMRGTDSCDIVFKDVFVPSAMAYDVFATKSFFDCPHSRLPMRLAYAIAHVAVAVGIARGALDEIIELARTKRPSMKPTATLGEDPVFRHQLAEQLLRFTACEAMMNQVTRDCEAEAGSLTPQQIMTGRGMGAYVTAECVKIVDWAYTMAGSHSVYEGSSLQRRLRDIHVATQHAAVHTETFRPLAAAALGETLSPMELF